MKILIVDDHAAMRGLLCSIVSRLMPDELQIIECESAQAAVSLYAAQQPDCVLMDLELGQMSGFEAIRQIRTGDDAARIIVVTSHDTAPFRARAEALQVNGFVTKDNLTAIEPLLISNPNPA